MSAYLHNNILYCTIILHKPVKLLWITYFTVAYSCIKLVFRKLGIKYFFYFMEGSCDQGHRNLGGIVRAVVLSLRAVICGGYCPRGPIIFVTKKTICFLLYIFFFPTTCITNVTKLIKLFTHFNGQS